MQALHRIESKTFGRKSKYCQENGRAGEGKVKKTLRTFGFSAHTKRV